MRLIDTHCHLNYHPEQIAHYVKKANEYMVTHMMTIGTTIVDIDDIVAICEQYDEIYAAIGLHPDHAFELNEQDVEAKLRKHITHDKVIGIGETGLDCYRNTDHIIAQENMFNLHINIANEYDVPVIIHSREAEQETLSILKNTSLKKGLLHCFTGSMSFAKKALDMGLFISFSGIITFKNAEAIREVVAYCPIDRMLIETDSPYLAPEPYRGKTNEPAFVTYVAKKIAMVKNIAYEEVCIQTFNNFCDLFSCKL